MLHITAGLITAITTSLIAIAVQTSAGLRLHMVWLRSCAFGAVVGGLVALVIRAM